MHRGFLSELFVSFQGEGAHVGRRHLFVRLAGCNLRCRYCDTPDSLERKPSYTISWSQGEESRPNPVSAADAAAVITALLDQQAPIDAVAVTGGEPLSQSQFLADMLSKARLPVPVLLETNGVLPRHLVEVLPHVSIVSMDIKLPSNTGEGVFWKEHEEFLRLASEKDLYVKVVVDAETDPEEVARAAALIGDAAPEAPLFLQPIVDASGSTAIDGTALACLFAAARACIANVRILPQTHKLLNIR